MGRPQVLAFLALLWPGKAYHLGEQVSICWETDLSVTDGEITMHEPCPEHMGAEILGDREEILAELRSFESRTIEYKCYMPWVPDVIGDDDGDGILDSTIPHANLHSCFNGVGFCTPFVANSPGLATHSPAKMGNVTPDLDHPGQYEFIVDGELFLEEGLYSVIAHCRAFHGDTKWDVAYAWPTVEVLPLIRERKVSQSSATVVAVLTGVCVAVQLVVFAYTVKNRKHAVMKFSQVPFLFGMMIMGLITTCGVLTNRVPTPSTCALRPWTGIIPLTALFSLLFAKTWRIIQVAGNTGGGKGMIKRTVVTAAAVFKQAMYLSAVQPVIQIASAMMGGNTVEQVFEENNIDFYLSCGSAENVTIFWWLSAAYTAALLCLGVALSERAKSLMSLFNESKYIAVVMHNSVIVGMITLMLRVAIRDQPDSYYLLVSTLKLLLVTSTILIFMIPKFKIIWDKVELSIGQTRNVRHIDVRSSGSGKPSKSVLPSEEDSIGKGALTAQPAKVCLNENTVQIVGRASGLATAVLQQHMSGRAVPRSEVADLLERMTAARDHLATLRRQSKGEGG